MSIKLMMFNKSGDRLLIHRELLRRSKIGSLNYFFIYLAVMLVTAEYSAHSWKMWLFGLVFLSLGTARYIVGYVYQRLDVQRFSKWRILFYSAVFTNALIWGVFTSTFIVVNSTHLTAAAALMGTLTLALESLVTFGAYYPVFIINLCLITLPPILSLFGAEEIINGPYLIVGLALTLLVAVIGRIINMDVLWRIRKNVTIHQQKIELDTARDKAIEAAKVKSQFLANISHELRSPMNVIIGMSGLLQDKKDLDEDSARLAESIRNSAEGLLSAINDILDFSKIETGKLELEIQPFDLVQCVESAFIILEPKAKEKGLKLRYSISHDVPLGIYGDVSRLRQILVSLMNNAVKFTEKGQIKVSVMKVAEQHGQAEIQFSVEDSGIGIPENRVERLFKSFSQVDASTARKFGGVGLGLAISKRLVDMMGGRIWVDSKFGYGSTFSFSIMAKLAELEDPYQQQTLTPEELAAVGRDNPLEILIAEDNNIDQHLMLRLLSKLGYRADLASNGYEAIESIKKKFYDIVFMDVQMPELSGLEATRIICDTWPKGGRPRITGMTATLMREDHRRCLEAGMEEIISKPLRINDLTKFLKGCPRRNRNNTEPAVKESVTPIFGTDLTIDFVQMLRICGNDKDLLFTSIDTFVHETDSVLERLDNSIKEKDIEQVESTAQTIKQRASTFIATSVVKMSIEIERAAKAGDFASCAEIAKRIRTEIQSLNQVLVEIQKSHRAA